jgi:hypothetical protein
VAAAAAVVLVAGGGSYAIIQGLGSGNGAGTSSDNAVGTSGSSGSRAEPRPGTSNAPVAPAFRAAGPALSYQRGAKTATIIPVTTRTNFVPGQLTDQISNALAQRQSVATGAGTSQPRATPGHITPNEGSQSAIGGFSLTALAGCVSRVAAGDQVILVDVATYQSVPAAVIVAQASPQGPRQVWVVGTGCSASRSDVLKHAALAAGG